MLILPPGDDGGGEKESEKEKKEKKKKGDRNVKRESQYAKGVLVSAQVYVLTWQQDYFCPILTIVSDALQLSPEVAGITILALGNGSPGPYLLIDLFISSSPSPSPSLPLSPSKHTHTLSLFSLSHLPLYRCLLNICSHPTPPVHRWERMCVCVCDK